MLYFKLNGAAVPWDGSPINRVMYPPDIETSWTAGALAALGLFAPLGPDPIPEGKQEIGRAVGVVAGVVKVVLTLADIPPPPEPPAPPALLPENYPLTMLQLRLGLKRFGGKPASFILDTINAMPEGDAQDYALIWYEETSEVHWDHAQTQALILASGLTLADAGAMWMATAANIPAGGA